MPADAAEAPTSGGTAVIAVAADPGHFNPAITTSSNVHAAADLMFNGLVALDRNLQPTPDLAESWTISAESTNYTFSLTPTARWHDGAPLTSDDVKFTFEEVLFKYHARTRAGLGAMVEQIDTPDNRTVVFRLKKPYAALLQGLDVTEAPILPKHAFSAGDPNTSPANLQPIGTGPFRFESYQPDDSVTLVRNPNYFKPGLPYLDKIVIRIIPDANTRLLALIGREVDYVSSVSGPDIERLQQTGGIMFVATTRESGGSNCIMTMSYNLDRPATAKPEVRQAIAHTIDRGQILRQVIFGQGRVAEAPISSGIPWAHAAGSLAEYDQNPTKAAALLDAAKYPPGPDGTRLVLDIVLFPTFTKYGEVIRQQLASLGIRLNLRPLDRAAFVDTVFAKRDFDLNLISYCNGLDPDLGVRRMYVSSNIGNIPFSNAAAYRNARVDALFASASDSADLKNRGALYREIQGILAQDLPYWWLVETDFTSAYRDAFQDFAPWTGQLAERAWMRR
jgi:peptide/nickel transport system substrate-binding protein